MIRRQMLVKLKPEHREGLKFVQLKQAAHTALMGVYGAQGVRIERAADDATLADWDICITIDYVSGVDEQRSGQDPIRIAFEQRFLAQRAERVWSGAFSSDSN